MSSLTANDGGVGTRRSVSEEARHLRRRRAAEARFKLFGAAALALGVFFLCVLLYSIITAGYQTFVRAAVELEINIDAAELDPDNRRATLSAQEMRPLLLGTDGRSRVRLLRAYKAMVDDAVLRRFGPEGVSERDTAALLSRSARVTLRDLVMADPSVIGTTQRIWFSTTSDVDSYLKGFIRRSTPEAVRQLNDPQLDLIDRLRSDGVIVQRFNRELFVNPTSPKAESAGLAVALIGSLQLMLVVLVLTVPIGVAASIYLEEFAPKNRITDLVEVNINNLAAVPSIVFGILGLAVFINVMELPRSSALVGGMVLSLMTLPTIIIATRASLKAVPPSVREAALGVGASKMQSIFHHVLPLAMPGILTGTIIGLAQALGETAPLLLIGMNAAVQEVPHVLDITDKATAMPSQIFQWSTEDDRTSFAPRTSAAIMVLLAFLFLMNVTAVLLRRRFERRW